MSGEMLTKHFSVREAQCPCCGYLDTINATRLAEMLEKLRPFVGPIISTSWSRCFRRNQKCNGKANSAHLRSLACDVLITGDVHRYLLVSTALTNRVTRLGIYYGMVHVDIDPSLPQHVIWAERWGDM